MSYVDGNSGSGRKALTGGTVALIQAGLALALINGFAVRFIRDAPPPRTEGAQIPLPPIPPKPVEDVRPDPQPPLVRDTFTRAPEPKIPLVADPLVDPVKPVQADPVPDGRVSEMIHIPGITAEPSPRFPPKVARPRNNAALWVTTDDYPTADIRQGHTGSVRFRLGIDVDGRVTDCSIVQSSGYDGLDRATCQNLTRRARFDPATDADGEKVAGSYAGTIRWVIPRD